MKYKHIISLGSFCSPALEIERFGFRDFSYPFDWVLSKSFMSVLKLIQTNFEDFIPDELYQVEDARYIYVNKKMNIWFVHDFDEWSPLCEQIEVVRDKYARRIQRFNEAIRQETIFLRYIENNDELNYVNENYSSIRNYLRTYNKENEIIFIANFDLKRTNDFEIPIYYVYKDIDDSVARSFLNQLPQLVEMLYECYYSKEAIKNNSNFYKKKIKKKRVIKINRKIKKIKYLLKGKREYQHFLIYKGDKY